MNANLSTTIANFLFASERKLRDAGVESARLDALVLICDALGREKSWVLAHDEQKLTPVQIAILDENVTRRTTHEPLAYIRGRVEFYGHSFYIAPGVLVPRPESESIVSLALYALKNTPKDGAPSIVDIGTGSGCLAISVKLAYPAVKATATDISLDALNVAKVNAHALRADIQFIQSDLLLGLLPLDQNHTYIFLANLPYVPEHYPINTAAEHEPSIALFSGNDGLNHYRQLFAQLELLPNSPRAIITESLLSQHHALAHLARQHNYLLEKTEGLAQLFMLSHG